ncbi:CMP-sialic acid transporter isoform X5 [Macaca fascicularis]|uniref:Solute carrier family 35 member A1 n=2 Tax=Cercopithecinae TaxID=9528 RepID=F7HQR1_MACMU
MHCFNVKPDTQQITVGFSFYAVCWSHACTVETSPSYKSCGVYFEKVLKSSDTSLWVRNIQMYLSGIIVTLVGVYLSDGAEIKEKGFFYGYTYYVWFVIFLASVGGLYTSVVVKYTDNIMKGFSAAAAIVLSTIASVMLFGLQITLTFALGTLLVCVSIYLYGLPRQDTTSIQQGETASKERVIGV